MQDVEGVLSKISILVVDDMESIRALVKSCLLELGAQKVTVDNDGEGAWKTLNSHRIDLIISDMDMPKIDGLTLLQRVRFSEKLQHIPFIMLTAETERDKVMESIKRGASDYVTKPFKPQDLAYRVIKQLRKIKIPA